MIRSDPHSGQYRKRGRLAFKKYDAGKIGEYRFSDTNHRDCFTEVAALDLPAWQDG